MRTASLPVVSLLIVVSLGFALPAHGAQLALNLVDARLALPRGTSTDLHAALMNLGTEPLYLNGVMHDLPSLLGGSGASDAFLSSAPLVLAPGEAWIGPVLHLLADTAADTGTSVTTITIVGGSGPYDATQLNTAYFAVAVSGDGVVSVGPGGDADAVHFAAVPNPFVASTRLRVQFAEARTIRVAVYDAAGRRVRDLFSGTADVGSTEFQWDGRNDSGHQLNAGTYYIKLVSGSVQLVSKAVLIR